MNKVKTAVWAAVVLGFVSVAMAIDVGISPSGHYFTYKGKAVLIMGESGGNVGTQSANFDYVKQLETVAKEGQLSVHYWVFIGQPVGDKRQGPYNGKAALYPWKKTATGFDLRELDEGTDPQKQFWPHLRAMCAKAKEQGLMIGFTVFWGWNKGTTGKTWETHPFNPANGGFATAIEDVQKLYDPSKEVYTEPWSDAFPKAKKIQWVWETYCAKLIEISNQYGNVWFDYRDEWSYLNPESEAAMPHWQKFFMSRGQIWGDRSKTASYYSNNISRSGNDAVIDWKQVPPQPGLETEGGYPFDFKTMRTYSWWHATRGLHSAQCNDNNDMQDIGVWAWDSVAGKGLDPAQDSGRLFVSYASRLMNKHVNDLDKMVPSTDLVNNGATCLANPGVEYVVYIPEKTASVTVQLKNMTNGKARFYNPRTGLFAGDSVEASGASKVFNVPNVAQDWVLPIQNNKPLAIESPKNNPNVQASPFPAILTKKSLEEILNGMKSVSSWHIIDLSGKRIPASAVSDFAGKRLHGLYFIQMKKGSEQSLFKVIIK